MIYYELRPTWQVLSHRPKRSLLLCLVVSLNTLALVLQQPWHNASFVGWILSLEQLQLVEEGQLLVRVVESAGQTDWTSSLLSRHFQKAASTPWSSGTHCLTGEEDSLQMEAKARSGSCGEATLTTRPSAIAIDVQQDLNACSQHSVQDS